MMMENKVIGECNSCDYQIFLNSMQCLPFFFFFFFSFESFMKCIIQVTKCILFYVIYESHNDDGSVEYTVKCILQPIMMATCI